MVRDGAKHLLTMRVDARLGATLRLVCPTGKSVWRHLVIVACLVPFAKIFCLAIEANQFTESRRPGPQEGRCATSSTRDGMRWTPAALKTKAQAGGRRSRVVPTPRRLVSSRRKFRRRR